MRKRISGRNGIMTKYVIAGGLSLLMGLALAVWLLGGAVSNCGIRCADVPELKQTVRNIEAHLKEQKKHLRAIAKKSKQNPETITPAVLWQECDALIKDLERERTYWRGQLKAAKTGFSSGPGMPLDPDISRECELP